MTNALLQTLENGRLEAEIQSLAAELRRRNVPFRFFLDHQLQQRELKLGPATLVAGHIPVIMDALLQLGIEPPRPNDYPDSLRPWLHRRVWMSTVGEVVAKLQAGDDPPFFAKPMGERQRFRGHILQSWTDLRALGGAPDHVPVICSEVVAWKSEYRVFVVRGRIVGIRHYRGEARFPIDRQQIEDAVARFEASGEATAGYGIDFGVLAGGQTALVEVNDGFSLASYGLENNRYTDLIVARWCELMERITGRV